MSSHRKVQIFTFGTMLGIPALLVALLAGPVQKARNAARMAQIT